MTRGSGPTHPTPTGPPSPSVPPRLTVIAVPALTLLAMLIGVTR